MVNTGNENLLDSTNMTLFKKPLSPPTKCGPPSIVVYAADNVRQLLQDTALAYPSTFDPEFKCWLPLALKCVGLDAQ